MTGETRYLGDIAYITNGEGDVQDASNSYCCEGMFPFFDRSEELKYYPKYMFDEEAIIYPGEGQSFMPRYYSGKFALHQRCYAIINFKDMILTKYCYYFMKTLNAYFLRTAVGSTVPSLRLENFTKLKIIIPSIDEQSKTINILDSFELNLRNEKLILSNLLKQKNYLLKSMFI